MDFSFEPNRIDWISYKRKEITSQRTLLYLSLSLSLSPFFLICQGEAHPPKKNHKSIRTGSIAVVDSWLPSFVRSFACRDRAFWTFCSGMPKVRYHPRVVISSTAYQPHEYRMSDGRKKESRSVNKNIIYHCCVWTRATPLIAFAIIINSMFTNIVGKTFHLSLILPVPPISSHLHQCQNRIHRFCFSSMGLQSIGLKHRWCWMLTLSPPKHSAHTHIPKHFDLSKMMSWCLLCWHLWIYQCDNSNVFILNGIERFRVNYVYIRHKYIYIYIIYT